MKALFTLQVNGEEHGLYTAPYKTLLEILREELGLTGTKHGCELGECGACTVLVDGQPMLACLLLPAMVAGCAITTIEGLAQEGRLHPLQQAFVEWGAAQCGYCIPGMLLTAKALLDQTPALPEPARRQQIRQQLAGNLCRCTGYAKIVSAVEAVIGANE